MTAGEGGGRVLPLIKREIDRLRGFRDDPVPPEELGNTLRAMDSAVSAYSDAMFAQAIAQVEESAKALPASVAADLRRSLGAAVEAFGEMEMESRKRMEEALRKVDASDKRLGGEARALFAAAARAEQLLLSASLDAGDGDAAGVLSNLEELAMLVAAGTAVRGSHKLKICLIGDGSVGKTSLIRRFVLDVFAEDYRQTLGAQISNKEMAVPASKGAGLARVSIAVWDIMGHEKLDRLVQSYLLGAHGAMIVFSVGEPKSFVGLEQWLSLADKVSSTLPKVVLANKSDLPEKRVSPFEMMRLAERLRCEVVPTSARTGMNVELAFSTVVRKALARSAKRQGEER